MWHKGATPTHALWHDASYSTVIWTGNIGHYTYYSDSASGFAAKPSRRSSAILSELNSSACTAVAVLSAQRPVMQTAPDGPVGSTGGAFSGLLEPVK